jgi:hypothetical protein
VEQTEQGAKIKFVHRGIRMVLLEEEIAQKIKVSLRALELCCLLSTLPSTHFFSHDLTIFFVLSDP